MACTAPQLSWPSTTISGTFKHGDGVLDRAEHRGVDDVTRGAHHEHVAESLVEDDLGGHPAVGAPEQHRRRLLPLGECRPVLDALAGMLGLSRDEALVTLLECLPCGHRS